MADSLLEKQPYSGSKNAKILFCDRCGVTFAGKKNLNAHLRNIHRENPLKDHGNKVCPEKYCTEKFRIMSQLQNHLTEAHSVDLDFTDLTFYAVEDFLEWKRKMEKGSKSSFILRSRKLEKSGVIFSYYICHRSSMKICQDDKKTEKRLRRRIAPSIKEDCTCPAMIKVHSETIDGLSEIKVNFQSKHVGHDLDVRKLRWKRKKQCHLDSSLSVRVQPERVHTQSKHLDHDLDVSKPCQKKKRQVHVVSNNIKRDLDVSKLHGERKEQVSLSPSSSVKDLPEKIYIQSKPIENILDVSKLCEKRKKQISLNPSFIVIKPLEKDHIHAKQIVHILDLNKICGKRKEQASSSLSVQEPPKKVHILPKPDDYILNVSKLCEKRKEPVSLSSSLSDREPPKKVHILPKPIDHDLDVSKLCGKRNVPVGLSPFLSVRVVLEKIPEETISRILQGMSYREGFHDVQKYLKVEKSDMNECQSNQEMRTAGPTRNKTQETCESLKTEIESLNSEIMQKIKDMNSVELLKIVKKHFEAVKAALI